MSVKGKVVWITASASGIGKATALLFAREGAKLVICDIDEVSLEATKREAEALGAEVLSQRCDSGSIEDMDRMFQTLIDHYGTIDILVNNAGIAGPTSPIIETNITDWDKTMEVNVRSMFYCIKLAAPVMMQNGGGKIVNLSSQSGKRALTNRAAYCASKMAVIGLTRTAADELGQYDITVNAVCPGAVSGPRLDFVTENLAKAKGVSVEEIWKQRLGAVPLQRTVPPEDVAQAVLFLSDRERSNSITGEEMNVNCGSIMY